MSDISTTAVAADSTPKSNEDAAALQPLIIQADESNSTAHQDTVDPNSIAESVLQGELRVYIYVCVHVCVYL